MSEEILDSRLRRKLLDTHKQMEIAGELLPLQRLHDCLSLFRSRFGPDALRQLDGERLLETMHASGKESLIYWLEFKNDDEFPGKFGSIAGGSSLKFGFYRRKESGIWMTGSPQKQRELSISEAIEFARRHRDQLIAGSAVIDGFPDNATDADYAALERELNKKAPDIGNTAWGHKYFSLLFPDKLDGFHAEKYQRFHLWKLLQRPPEIAGRYLAAGRFVRLARELEWPLNHLMLVLNQANGQPYRIWRVGTDLGDAQSDTIWPLMQESGCVAIGWPKMGDLSTFEHNQKSKTQIGRLFHNHYDHSPVVGGEQGGSRDLQFRCRHERG